MDDSTSDRPEQIQSDGKVSAEPNDAGASEAPAAVRVLKVGLIGPGSIADNRLAPALSRMGDAVLWSVCGRDLDRTSDFATKHGAKSGTPAHTDIDSFLADKDLDAVIIASPDKLHAPQALKAIAAGKHVFIEKPMATSSQEADAILQAASTAGVRVAVGYHLRFHEGHKALAELIAAGHIGKIRHVNISWTLIADANDWRAQDAMGRWWSLGALGTHALDLVRWLAVPSCGAIKEAHAVTSNGVFKGPHDETALVSLVLENGATAHVLSSVVFRAPRVVEIFGTDGSIRCTDTLGPRGTGQIIVNGEELPFTPADPYYGELTDFINAVKNGTSPSVDGREGFENIALLERLAHQGNNDSSKESTPQ